MYNPVMYGCRKERKQDRWILFGIFLLNIIYFISMKKEYRKSIWYSGKEERENRIDRGGGEGNKLRWVKEMTGSVQRNKKLVGRVNARMFAEREIVK